MPPLASIPSPSQGVWDLGPIPIRAYALCIVLGVIVAVWIGEHRWRARGGAAGTITDLAVWAVPFGLVGGRLYHVITDWQLYFGSEAPNRPIDTLFIWKGGLGIWGAIALGALGVYIGCRRRGISFTAVADALAPAVAVAQAIGRWGNYFNQELFGSPTTLPWGLEIDPGRPGAIAGVETYHPTFLYESLWDLALAGVLVLLARRFTLRHGRLLALYVAGYTLGRFWIEGLRVDPAHHILGLRLNQWTSVVIFILAVAYFWFARNRKGEEIVDVPVEPADGDGPAADAAADASEDGSAGERADGSELAAGQTKVAAFTSEPVGETAGDAAADTAAGAAFDTAAESASDTAEVAVAEAAEEADGVDPAHQRDQADESDIALPVTAPDPASADDQDGQDGERAAGEAQAVPDREAGQR
jgi:prolipoprotein diacylglyceryl transferase